MFRDVIGQMTDNQKCNVFRIAKRMVKTNDDIIG